jgi:transcription initiation factor TFIID subunit 1
LRLKYSVQYSDTSVNYCFECRYCEERPLLLSNAGMGARLCTYYQKTSPADQTATSLRNNRDGLGTVLAIDPADKSPFLGDIRSGSHQSCIETNMYRSPIFPHKVAPTDYLLVRSAKGVLSLRRIDKLCAVGQQVSYGAENTVFCINGMCNACHPFFICCLSGNGHG